MKQKYAVGLAIVVCLLINTSYFWEKWIGLWAWLLILVIILVYVALTIKLIVWLVHLIKSRFVNWTQNREFATLLAVQTTTIFFPFGLIDFRQFEGEDLIKAQREGVANCMLYINLKTDNNFIEEEICFGTYERRGTYRIKGDTIHFTFQKDRTGLNKQAVGVLIADEFSKPLGKTILYFTNAKDTLPLRLTVTKLPKH